MTLMLHSTMMKTYRFNSEEILNIHVVLNIPASLDCILILLLFFKQSGQNTLKNAVLQSHVGRALQYTRILKLSIIIIA